MAVSLCILSIGVAGAAMRRPVGIQPGFSPPALAPTDSLTERSYELYPVRVTWAGVGQLRSFTVNNAALLGLHEPAGDWQGYDGTWPENSTNWNAFCCEWPAGSRQFYNFSTGIWVGGKVAQVVGPDTVRVPIVATGAYDPDFTPVSPLWASNQYVPPIEDGLPLFVQPGEERKSYQIEWGNDADFQGYRYYAHTDTASINQRRRAAFGTSDYDLKPTDFISEMDTYCMLGDHVPADIADSVGYWLYPSNGYDIDPVGVRLEQRTHSWSYGPAANVIFINYKVTNETDFSIDSLYVGYFMDNDVGPGELEEQGVGPNDDLIGFDVNLNLGYTYDSNFNEPGWATAAGYIGVVYCETPINPITDEPFGLTSFATWTREGPEGQCDLTDQDDRKFAELRGFGIPDDPDDDLFETFEEADDVRHLSSSGPYLSFLPGQTVSVTFAVVMGQSLDELKNNTMRAVQQFEMGYLGTAPPPSPNFVVTPQDQEVYISWDNSPEDVVDLITNEADFEGYRIYRSLTGVEGNWELLADYDVMGSQTTKRVKVTYARGGSELDFGFVDFYGTGSDTIAYVGNNYALEFQTDSLFTVFNTDQQRLYRYSSDAEDVFTGDFCVLNEAGVPYDIPDQNNEFLGKWHSGARIYIDGFYIHITEGTPKPNDPEGTYYGPRPGDLFDIASFNWNALGDQTGLYYSYTDENLINGLTYYYAVTSYDKGSPSENIEPLESSVAQSKVSVIPRSRATDKEDPVAAWTRVSPAFGTGEFYLNVVQPTDLTGHDYRVECVSVGPEDDQAWAWIMRDLDEGIVISDTMTILEWDFDNAAQVSTITYPDELPDQQPLDGMMAALKAPKAIRVEESEIGWNEESDCSWAPTSSNWNQYSTKLEPYDYAMTFPAGGGTDVDGDPVPWHMINLTLGVPAKTYLFQSSAGDPDKVEWDSYDQIFILLQDSETWSARDAVVKFSMNMEEDDSSPAGVSDTLYIRTIRPFYPGDGFRIETAHMLADKSSYSLDAVKVVPNPYYLRAMWDTNQYNRWVNFTHLPSECSIRIFTLSGLLIRELEHDEEGDDGTERWDLLTEERMLCTSGLYIYQVEDRGSGKTAVGKFVIVR